MDNDNVQHLRAASADIIVNQPLYMREEEIAERFSVSVFFIRKLRYAGKLRASTINGRLIRIKVADADAFFESHATGGDMKTRSVGSCAVWRKRRTAPVAGRREQK